MIYQDYQLMNNETKNTMVPRLRFPEFENAKEWKEEQLIVIAPELFDGDWIESNDQAKSGIRIIQTGNIGIGEFITKSENARYVSNDTFKRLRCTEVFPGDCLISRLPDPIGRSCFIPEIGIRMITAVDCLIVRFNKQLFIPYIFVLFSQTDKYLQEIKAKASGSTRERISKENLSRVLIPVANIKEQQKIADCLSSLDELITVQSQKLEALKAHKKGLMQQLFPADGEMIPKLRFAEFRDSGEWEEISLIDVTDKKVKWSFIGGPFGSNLKSSDYVLNGVRIIQLQNIGDGEFKDDYKIFTSNEKANELLSCNIYPGDIILSKMGDPVGRACLIPNIHSRYVMCSDGIRLVVNEQKHSKYFIYTLINSASFRSLVDKTATGSTRKRIGLDDLKNLPLVVPQSLKEQQKIADCLSSLDELITAQTEKIEALTIHKKGLMQGLFPNITDSI